MDKEEILQIQEEKIKSIKTKKELIEQVTKIKIRKGGWQGLRLFTIGVFENVYNRKFEEYWYHELIFRILWNVIIGKRKKSNA